jgi:hypothetical protein
LTNTDGNDIKFLFCKASLSIFSLADFSKALCCTPQSKLNPATDGFLRLV